MAKQKSRSRGTSRPAGLSRKSTPATTPKKLKRRTVELAKLLNKLPVAVLELMTMEWRKVLVHIIHRPPGPVRDNAGKPVNMLYMPESRAAGLMLMLTTLGCRNLGDLDKAITQAILDGVFDDDWLHGHRQPLELKPRRRHFRIVRCDQ